jgi:hypothetical protein
MRWFMAKILIGWDRLEGDAQDDSARMACRIASSSSDPHVHLLRHKPLLDQAPHG